MPTVQGGRPGRRGDSLSSEMRSIRWVGVFMAAVVLCAALALAPADAKKKKRGLPKVKTAVTLAQTSQFQLRGKVKSRLSQCRQQRLIAVYYTDPADGPLGTQPVSVQRTNNKSKYVMNLPQPSYAGAYQTVVVAQIVRAEGKRQKCREARSKVVNVPGS